MSEYKPRYRVTLDLTLTKSHKYDIGFLHALLLNKLATDGVEIAGLTVVDIASLNSFKADAAAAASAGTRGTPHTNSGRTQPSANKESNTK